MASSTIFGSCSPGVIFGPSLINPPCPALSSISCVCGGRRVVRLRAEVKSNKAISEGSEQKWVVKGVITESLPNGMFWVRLENGDVVLGYISGKIRRNSIRMLAGDKVKIEVSRYDSTRGRIVYRMPSRDS